MKKYKVITKIDNNRFVKYNVNNLLLFTNFLDKRFPDWRYFNVYEYSKDNTGSQIGNYTKTNRPDSRHIPF